MGNANGREVGAADDPSARSNGPPATREIYAPNLHPPVRAVSSDLMAQTPPPSPGGSRSPLLFNPQVMSLPMNFKVRIFHVHIK